VKGEAAEEPEAQGYLAWQRTSARLSLKLSGGLLHLCFLMQPCRVAFFCRNGRQGESLQRRKKKKKEEWRWRNKVSHFKDSSTTLEMIGSLRLQRRKKNGGGKVMLRNINNFEF